MFYNKLTSSCFIDNFSISVTFQRWYMQYPESKSHSTLNTDEKGKTCVKAFGILKQEVRTYSLQKKLNSNLF
jgi:hypothetical protein